MTNSRLVVYTALLGGYDRLRPPPTCTPRDTLFVCFTDQPRSIPVGWTTVRVPCATDLDARIRQARFYKTQPHTVLGAHEVSIWIDANLELVVSPADLSLTIATTDIATFQYPSTWGTRDCIYQEARACVERGKDDKVVIEAHMERYRSLGYPEHNGLVETSIMVRRNTAAVVRVNDCWWQEIQVGSRRDQLSFNYSVWTCKQPYSVIPGSRRSNPLARFYPHAVEIYPRCAL